MSRRLLLSLVALMLVAASVGAASARGVPRRPLRFVRATSELIAMCHATARAVGYPVPCPTSVPAGLAPVGGRVGCSLEIIGPGLACPNTSGCWCGWVVGSSTAGQQSLVLVASPHPLASYARVVDGPAWYPAARARPLGWLTVNGRRMREVWVPAETNDASSFSDHLALIWTAAGHTYAVGFQHLDGMAATLSLDRTLAAGIRLVG